MGVILTDLGDATHDLSMNWWNWRPTLELIRSFNLIDEERLERMSFSCGGGHATEQEAHEIAKRIREGWLSRMSSGERLKLDVTTTEEPDDFKMHFDEVEKNYSAHRSSLEGFVEFCMASNGFRVM
jgi:hypothetical protein